MLLEPLQAPATHVCAVCVEGGAGRVRAVCVHWRQHSRRVEGVGTAPRARAHLGKPFKMTLFV